MSDPEMPCLDHVINRRGVKIPVRFDAITDRNAVLCSVAYGRHLAYVEALLPTITQAVVRRFRNGMSTHEVDMLTAEVCVAQSTQHRDFGDLAARIVVSDLQKQTVASMADTVRRLHSAVNASGESISRLHPEFVGIVSRAGPEIDRRLDFTRDFRFTYFGILTMLRSYLMRKSGVDSPAVERPQHAYMRVALALCLGQPDRRGHEAPDCLFRDRLERAFELYDLLSTHRLTHASPTMFNAGTKFPQLSSCYLLGVDDDLDTLLQVDKDAGMISKWAGGVGICLTPMRAKGALIKSSGGTSGGLRDYVVKLNSGQLYVNQGGLRRGAYAIYLEPWHADVLTFLQMGRFKGVPISAPDLKYALWVNDLFMEAIEEELAVKAARERGEPVAEDRLASAGDWHLFSPDRAPGLEKSHGAEFRALYGQYVAEQRYERVVKASTILTEWFKTVAQRGNPYILFKDHINAKSNLSHYRTITNSNLCVSGETAVLTSAGQIPISLLADQEVRVWNGTAWSTVTVRQTSPAAALVRVTLDNGAVLDCTPDHRFYDHTGAELRAKALTPGTKLERATKWPVIEDGDVCPLAYQHGWFCASGTPEPNHQVASGRTALEVRPPKFVPLTANLESRMRWLEGFCDGAACVSSDRASLTVRPTPSGVVFLNDVRLMLQTMGCDPEIRTEDREEGTKCGRQKLWSLVLTSANLQTLIDHGFTHKWLDLTVRRPADDVRRFARIVSVAPLAKAAPTYCFTEPLRHRGVFGGVLTGQCAEITIPCFNEVGKPAEYGTCNLAAVPLAAYVVPDARAENSGRVRIAWDSLIAAAGVAVRNLDNVIDVSFYPIEACRSSNLQHRPVAIGVMGLADVFAMFKYAYGSAEARALDRALHAAIYYGAMLSSSELGAERGNFATFVGSPSQQGLLQPDLWVRAGHLESSWEAEVAATTGGALNSAKWAELREACRHHLRNAYVTADMPTATSSQATGQNECFEPFTSNLYTRKTLAGEFTLLNTHLLLELETLGLWNDEMRRTLIASGGSIKNCAHIPADVRERFRTARELDQRLLTLHAKARNPFLSQSQSLNYFFGEPNLKDMLTVIVLGWKEGLTTGAYYIHTQPATGTQKTSIIQSSSGSPAGCTGEVCTACAV